MSKGNFTDAVYSAMGMYGQLHPEAPITERSNSESIESIKASRRELSDAIRAALCDAPDWRRLCVDALAKAEGRKENHDEQ